MDMYVNVIFTTVGIIIGGIITWFVSKKHSNAVFQQLREWMGEMTLNEEFSWTAYLAEQLRHNGWEKPDLICAISPGGGMIAEWLSRKFLGTLESPIPVHTIPVTSKRDRSGETSITTTIDSRYIDEGCPIWKSCGCHKILIVNDISRGGGTLNVVINFLKEHHPTADIQVAVLINHENSSVIPRFCVITIDKPLHFEWKDKLIEKILPKI